MAIDRLGGPTFPPANVISSALPDRRDAKLKVETGWDTAPQPRVRVAQVVTVPVGSGTGPAALINAVPQARVGTPENRAMVPWTQEAREQAAPVWNRFTRAWRRAGYLWNEGSHCNFIALRDGLMGRYPEQGGAPRALSGRSAGRLYNRGASGAACLYDRKGKTPFRGREGCL
jgi:hypothetical protein